MKYIDFNPDNHEIEKILERLMQYPNLKTDGRKAQHLFRYPEIRELNRNRKHKLIMSERGLIALSPKVKITKPKIKGFRINIF